MRVLVDRLDNLDSPEPPTRHSSESIAIVDTLKEEQKKYNTLEKKFNKFQETFFERMRETKENLTSLENGQKIFEEFENDFPHGEFFKESIKATLLELLHDKDFCSEAQPYAIVQGMTPVSEVGNSSDISQLTSKIDEIQEQFNRKIDEENTVIMEEQSKYNMLDKKLNKLEATIFDRMREIKQNVTCLESAQKMFEEFENDFHDGEIGKETIKATVFELLHEHKLCSEAEPNALTDGVTHANQFGNNPELSQVATKLEEIQQQFHNKIVDFENKHKNSVRTLGVNVHRLAHFVQQLSSLSFDIGR